MRGEELPLYLYSAEGIAAVTISVLGVLVYR